MDTLHHRLADLAKDAPTGGAPPTEIWARGKRTHRFRAAALAAAVLVVGAVGTGIGVDLADRVTNRFDSAPATKVHIGLPIEYPVGENLPDLGVTPGSLAAIWLAPRVGFPRSAPEVVGLVAETGTFGTLPINVIPDDPDGPDYIVVALSADGRRMAYLAPTGELVVHDLVSGEDDSPLSEFKTRAGFTWVDATHLLGHVAGGSDGDGWAWQPGEAPTLVNPYDVPYGGTDLTESYEGLGPRECSMSPILLDGTGKLADGSHGSANSGAFEVPVLCDVLGVVPDSEILLGHWNSERFPGDWGDPNDRNRTVVALDIRGADSPFDDPSLRHVLASAGAPERVTFATGLIGAALDADGDAS